MSGTDDDAKPVDVISAQAAKGQMDPIPAAFAEVTQRLNTGRDARLALTDRVTTAEGKVSTLQSQMQTQQARVIPPDLSSAVTAVQAKNTAQDGRLDAVEAKNTAQDGRLTTLEARTAITRIETYTATSNASAIATFSFPAFAQILDISVKKTWVGNQEVGGGVTAQTLTGCTVLAKRSKGTLLLTDGPFENAPSTPVTIVVYGR